MQNACYPQLITANNALNESALNPLLQYCLEDLKMICFDEKKVTIVLRKNSPKEFVFPSKEQLDAAVEEWFNDRKSPRPAPAGDWKELVPEEGIEPPTKGL